mmetsp:Transcript_30156/g.69927  ORF Transcript_30156/g.69927 Transcript_30156/m.69927 type:complete len:221 (+) Transcript_30156:56-718(+)
MFRRGCCENSTRPTTAHTVELVPSIPTCTTEYARPPPEGILTILEAHFPENPEVPPLPEGIPTSPEAHIPENPEAPPLPEGIPTSPEAYIPEDPEAPPLREGLPEHMEAPDKTATAEEHATQEVAAPPEWPVGDGLALTFVHEGLASVFTLRRTELGFELRANPPQNFVVVSFVHKGGQAECVGVKVGMELVAISGGSTEGDAPTDIHAKLAAETAELEV